MASLKVSVESVLVVLSSLTRIWARAPARASSHNVPRRIAMVVKRITATQQLYHAENEE